MCHTQQVGGRRRRQDARKIETYPFYDRNSIPFSCDREETLLCYTIESIMAAPSCLLRVSVLVSAKFVNKLFSQPHALGPPRTYIYFHRTRSAVCIVYCVLHIVCSRGFAHIRLVTRSFRCRGLRSDRQLNYVLRLRLRTQFNPFLRSW